MNGVRGAGQPPSVPLGAVLLVGATCPASVTGAAELTGAADAVVTAPTWSESAFG